MDLETATPAATPDTPASVQGGEQTATEGRTIEQAIAQEEARLEAAQRAPASDPDDAGTDAQGAGEGDEGAAEPHPQYREGDPEGTFRDQDDRLRDAATGQFVSGEGGDAAAGGGDEAGADADAGAGDAQALVVSLPGRGPEDPDLDIEAPDAETAEALRRMRNGYMRREQLNRERAQVDSAREQIAAEREELDYIHTQLQENPVDFVLEHVGQDIRADLARHLLADDAVYEAVIEDVSRWQHDDIYRDRDRSRLEAERLRRRDELRRSHETATDAKRNARQIHGSIGALAEQVAPERAHLFQRNALDAVKRELARTGAKRLDPAHVPEILRREGVLELFGVRPTAPAAAGDADTPARRPDPAAPAADPAEQARKNGERIQKAIARRRVATAVAPAGAGAGSARPRPPEGQTIEERIDWLEKHGG